MTIVDNKFALIVVGHTSEYVHVTSDCFLYIYNSFINYVICNSRQLTGDRCRAAHTCHMYSARFFPTHMNIVI